MNDIDNEQLNEMILESLKSSIRGLLGEKKESDIEKKVEDEEDDDETVEEASSMAAGDVAVGAGHPNKRDEQDTIIREVYDYLVSTEIIRID